MAYLNDQRLLAVGLDNMIMDDLNNLYLHIATIKNVQVNQVSYADALEYYKGVKLADLSAKCDAQVAGNYKATTTGFTYRTLPNDLFNMLGIYTMVKDDDTVTTVNFYTVDADADVSHAKADFLSVAKELFKFVQDTNSKFDGLRKNVKDAADGTAVLGINW